VIGSQQAEAQGFERRGLFVVDYYGSDILLSADFFSGIAISPGKDLPGRQQRFE
jgi:hypothetical protein